VQDCGRRLLRRFHWYWWGVAAVLTWQLGCAPVLLRRLFGHPICKLEMPGPAALPCPALGCAGIIVSALDARQQNKTVEQVSRLTLGFGMSLSGR
jgi:hypothetical protein